MPHRAGSVARILLAAALLFATSFAAIEPTAVVAQPRSDDFLLERAAVASRLQDLLSSHTPAKTWFRLEEPGYPPVELAFGGASSGRLLSLGSVSKTVTGIGIALLIQEGRIELNTKMKDILGEYFVRHGSRLDPSLDDITVERLLTHRAGLRGNLISDPIHGLATAEVTSKVGGETEFFDYLAASGENQSDGRKPVTYCARRSTSTGSDPTFVIVHLVGGTARHRAPFNRLNRLLGFDNWRSGCRAGHRYATATSTTSYVSLRTAS
jgi:hypothetical protein